MSVFDERRRRVTEAIGTTADALLVTHPTNIRYLTGFTGSNAQLLLDSDPVFFTDGRYTEQAASEVPDLERVIYTGATKLTDLLKGLVGERGTTKLAVEGAHMSVATRDRFSETLSGVELVASSEVVEGVRTTKDAKEIDAIRGAQRIAEGAVTSVLRSWSSGTEAELALALEWAIRTAGAEAVSFDVIVATGPHAALPHATPRDVPAALDGVLLIDIGAKVEGYCSDMTRTYLGPQASEKLVAAHASVVAALEAGCAAIAPGVRAADVDKAARDRLEADGLGELFVHSTGHGVGLDIHEAPSLTVSSEGVLAPGMIVTIEPGVYLPGVGGIRVEDLLVVTDAGAENLTALDRDAELPR